MKHWHCDTFSAVWSRTTSSIVCCKICGHACTPDFYVFIGNKNDYVFLSYHFAIILYFVLNCGIKLATFVLFPPSPAISALYWQVDAHNIVPCWVASPKLEYSARTIRGKITNLLPEFLTDFPPVEKHQQTATRTAKVSSQIHIYIFLHLYKIIKKNVLEYLCI